MRITEIKYYNILKNGKLMNSKPVTIDTIRKAFGGVLKVEQLGLRVIPIKVL